MEYCTVCGHVDDKYDENANALHCITSKHGLNFFLRLFDYRKVYFYRNNEGIQILITVPERNIKLAELFKVRVMAKPKEVVKIKFKINNISDNCHTFIGIAHGQVQPNFKIVESNEFILGRIKEKLVLKPKKCINEEIVVEFVVPDIGLFVMHIAFVFLAYSGKPVVIVREMIMNIQESITGSWEKKKYPHSSAKWGKIGLFFMSSHKRPPHHLEMYNMPQCMKTIFCTGITEDGLQKMVASKDAKLSLRHILVHIRAIIDEGVTRENYIMFWHYLLWWEEAIARITLRRYNMGEVFIVEEEGKFKVEVPGIAEKRPSVIRGDRVYVRPCANPLLTFEGIIVDLDDVFVHLGGFSSIFRESYTKETTYNIRFIKSRVPLERMHIALSNLLESKQFNRLFPERNRRLKPLTHIDRYFNKELARNYEQTLAVRRIVGGNSGRAPYMVFGPPGTGKTVTIVEAIAQLVVKNARNRIMVCTYSNMAADVVACTLLKYKKLFDENNIKEFMFRANSRNRNWESMPAALATYSNGNSYETFYACNPKVLANYRVVVTTIQHSAKYGAHTCVDRLKITHLFIDEAAQSLEPATLIPITGVLEPNGQLILSGDPKQLGPVCLSRSANDKGLGVSLMERLRLEFPMYDYDANYIGMLKQNFRSVDTILRIPNELFYDNELVVNIKDNKLSQLKILKNFNEGAAAIVFHSVNSKEQRVGQSPSFFNDKELEMMQRYVKALLVEHKLTENQIGIISPYARQVYKIKHWLNSQNYKEIEVGTVEGYQGKEKDVILISTVRANCKLLDYDAKYDLGFLVDDKRFNVALTRAKSKLVIIGNAACLNRDKKWRIYMEACQKMNSYLGRDCEQIPRNAELFKGISNRFDMCGLAAQMKELYDKEMGKKNKEFKL